MTNDIIRDNLARLMEAHNMVNKKGEPNQTALASVAAVNQKTVGNLLRKDWDGTPTLETLEAIARALGVAVWQLTMPRLPAKSRSVRALRDGLDEQMLDLCATFRGLTPETRQHLIDLAEFHAQKARGGSASHA